jgi:hypothetical protein
MGKVRQIENDGRGARRRGSSKAAVLPLDSADGGGAPAVDKR